MLLSVLGPGAFALAAYVGGRREPGYQPRDEPISALAARGTRSAPVMVPGFLALAVATVGFANELRGTTVAPAPVPAMLAAAGVSVGAAGLARCSDRSCPTRGLNDFPVTRSDDLHAAVSAATFALWIATPLVAARRATGAGPRYRRASRVIGLTTLATLVAGGLLARRPDSRGSGTGQRVMLASAFSWYVLAGANA